MFAPGRPDSVILTVDWRIDMEQLLICEENDLALLHGQALKQQLAALSKSTINVQCCIANNSQNFDFFIFFIKVSKLLNGTCYNIQLLRTDVALSELQIPKMGSQNIEN